MQKIIDLRGMQKIIDLRGMQGKFTKYLTEPISKHAMIQWNLRTRDMSGGTILYILVVLTSSLQTEVINYYLNRVIINFITQ